ncbi:hypothetical protein AA16373_3173 [Komagataeibacter swingsii DSM 16373]|nr:hypothetical protein AA16373_3173 [Komagataeibacter swingsii DSM 16373]
MAGLMAAAPPSEDYTTVLNQRFKEEDTTRHYGAPAQGIHAIQREIAQHADLKHEAAPFEPDRDKCARLKTVITAWLDSVAAWRPA